LRLFSPGGLVKDLLALLLLLVILLLIFSGGISAKILINEVMYDPEFK
jgi:hypothetical protein